MKDFILFFFLLIGVSVFGQAEFTINKDGLDPTFSTIHVNTKTKSELYTRTLEWIEENEANFKLTLDEQIENTAIQFTSIKGNAVTLDKQYFNVKYDVIISFKEGLIKFEPKNIELKVNSKYDMGWKPFDLKNGDDYFKKGKIIRKYKSYLKDLMTPLNSINKDLSDYLNKD